MGMKQALGHGQPSVPFGPGLGNKCIFSRLGTALKPLAVNELTLAGKPDSRTQAQRLERQVWHSLHRARICRRCVHQQDS